MGEGEDVPYRPTDAKSCRVGGGRDAGPGGVLGVCDVPEKLAKGAARLAGADGVALRLPRTTVWEDHALKIGPAATVLIAGADTVLVRGRLARPGAWREDEDGRRIATFRASRIVVTD